MSKSTKLSKPNLKPDYETQAKNDGLRFVFGIDEAGRGPLAGPVVAAAVCLTSFDFKRRIDDSKKLSATQRTDAFEEIFQNGYVGIGMVSEVGIDQINILNATFHAMDLAVNQLCRYMHADDQIEAEFNDQVLMLVDGNAFKTTLPYKHKTIIGGDAVCLSIACASIVAKVYRDRMMENYNKIYPQYGFSSHKGYGTATHQEALEKHGLSPIHRKTFTL